MGNAFEGSAEKHPPSSPKQ